MIQFCVRYHTVGLEGELPNVIGKLDRIQVNKDKRSQKGKNKGKDGEKDVLDFTLGGDQAW